MNYKRRKSIDVDGHIHEFTFSVYRRMPVFVRDPKCAELFLYSLDRARSQLKFSLLAYVVMPEHVHLLIQPSEGCTVARVLKAIKQPSSVRIRDHLRVANPSLVAQLVAPSKGSVENRFWQQGGGFDRNVPDEDALGNMINYIHMNPVRRGLCESMFDWPFSSARGYYPELSDPPPIPIDLVG